MVCLIKPQFEAGKERVGKKGVVRDPAVHEDVIEMVWKFSEENGYKVLGLDQSPIKGPEGNIEYLIYLEKCGADEAEKKWGHKLRMAVRVPAYPADALGLGMDVPTWVKEGLIDVVIPSPGGLDTVSDTQVALWRAV